MDDHRGARATRAVPGGVEPASSPAAARGATRRGPGGHDPGAKPVESARASSSARSVQRHAAARDVHRRLLPLAGVTVLSTDRASTRSRSAADTSRTGAAPSPRPGVPWAGAPARSDGCARGGRPGALRPALRQRDEGAPALAVTRTAARPGRDGATDAAGGARGPSTTAKTAGRFQHGATRVDEPAVGRGFGVDAPVAGVAACVEIKFRAPYQRDVVCSMAWSFQAIATLSP